MDRIRAEYEYKINKMRSEAAQTAEVHLIVVNELNKLKSFTTCNVNSFPSDLSV